MGIDKWGKWNNCPLLRGLVVFNYTCKIILFSISIFAAIHFLNRGIVTLNRLQITYCIGNIYNKTQLFVSVTLLKYKIRSKTQSKYHIITQKVVKYRIPKFRTPPPLLSGLDDIDLFKILLQEIWVLFMRDGFSNSCNCLLSFWL